jgi:hypothetical protein
MKPSITVAYSGVHQAFQIALAAAELNQLDYFYCSLFAAPGKWGGALARLIGADRLHNRTVAGLPPRKAWENPWPLIGHRCRMTLSLAALDDWEHANRRFDRWVAERLGQSDSRLFVGVETCAAAAFAAAQERGMVRLLDRPGIGAEFLSAVALKAADELGLKTVAHTDSPMMRELKAREVRLADTILVASELQARLLRQSLASPKRACVLPLWADSEFWRPPDEAKIARSGPLRVIYAGKLSLRKGVPYLIQAALDCSHTIALTLIGAVDPELTPVLERHDGKFTLVAPCAKADLRRHYQQNDLLVLPSLGDSFGLVAMEAMACGLPVIVTENCGVPVPDAAWRVPVMNSDALAARLALYAGDRELCREHGRIAVDFAKQFTPERYRRQLHDIFYKLLSCPQLEAQPEARSSIDSHGEQWAEASNL